ncbi:Mitotic spindle assembly checkpoint protein MAD1 [Operophtera brumata]|uniref:Mitotic spindle assembly checkpoint protein MAD1 n=1 Tax=Operophtera brumata TaxID=104452 RepID=A0A0L7KPZ5_OPEBR|nr:Mitotic spindle assembly checkpoint protein MAD1 [Operophtera brumata]
MANEGDMSLFNDVLEPFRRVINTDPPKDKFSASSKLNFSDSNQSLKEGLGNFMSGCKRKCSIGSDGTPDKRMRRDSESSNKSNAPPASPWEARRLKIDLIGAKAQITKLEARVNHQHTIRKEMQILFEEEKASLLEQHKRDERALIADLKDKLLEANVSSKDQLSEMKKDMDELLQALEAAQSEADMLKKEVSKQTEKADQCVSLRNQLEKQTFELQQATKLEKEVARLRATERSLRDGISSKLLLEEQVHMLTSRVEALQPVQQELHEAKVPSMYMSPSDLSETASVASCY